jgi:hypothetical protein
MMRVSVGQLGMRLLRVLPLPLRRRVLYLRWQRRPLRLRDPQLFSEKVNWRIVHDRRPVLAETCDKLAIKEMVSTSPVAVEIAPTLWVGEDVRELADCDLPDHWVLKPNHRSGLVHFGTGPADVAALARITEGWLDDMQTVWFGEWAYGRARRLLLCEERVGPPTRPPEDYKFFCFAGHVEIVQVDWDRFGRHTRRFYEPRWTPLPNMCQYPLASVTPPPPDLERMIQVARTISVPFDFVRVDLYDVGGRVYFGELTPYPGSGLERFVPRDLDGRLGSHWRLPTI